MKQMAVCVSKSSQGRIERQDILRRCQEKVENTALPLSTVALPVLGEEAFHSAQAENIRLLSYFRRMVSLLDWPEGIDQPLFALFDPEGCLLELYGSPEARAAASRSGICPQTCWGLRQIGVNAVSVGLEEDCTLYSVGDENHCAPLKNYAIYFSPLVMELLQPPYDTVRRGGVALLVPSDQRHPRYLSMASLAAHDLKLNVQFADVAYELYDQTGMGVLAVDSRLQDNAVIATFCNDILFRMLGVPPVDIYFKPIDRLIDPLPKNPEFWAVFTEQKPLTDENMTLSVQGKKVNCIVTAKIINQSGLNVRSVNFFITTPQSISATVSARMGNSAVRTFGDMVGRSRALRSAIQRGRILAQSDSNIMLWGESGVGKDVFAQSIHNSSRRRDKPFIAVNCGALPRELIASELFGYVGGAFTGANRQGNIGKFELANGGTIFLDEIGELPLDLQATLLRVVEQKQLTRLGGSKVIDIDVKIISATNADLPAMIQQKRFRADLYFRLSTMTLSIPPLRERGEDVILLAEHFIRTLAVRSGDPNVKHLSDDAKRLLMKLPWIGNVRELENVIESVVYLYPDPVIDAQHISENISMMDGTPVEPAEAPVIPANSPEALLLELPWSGSAQELEDLIGVIARRYPDTLVRAQPAAGSGSVGYGRKPPAPKKRKQLTAEDIREASASCGGARSEMARYLGVSRATLYRYLERFGL